MRNVLLALCHSVIVINMFPIPFFGPILFIGTVVSDECSYETKWIVVSIYLLIVVFSIFYISSNEFE